MSFIAGVGLTSFGRHPTLDTLDLMTQAADDALQCAQFERRDIDGLLCGYSSTMPHLMLASVFAEHFGLAPAYAHAVQVGGATGLALVMLAHLLIVSGAAQRILVVAGENRLSGQSRDGTLQMLAQVGHPRYEVPLGLIVPGYYALLADRYLHDHALREADLAEFAVLMRRRAAAHPGAHLREPISVTDVLASRPIATPLKLLDCCPISDGAAAILVTREPCGSRHVRIRGVGQAHLHQHVSAALSLSSTGAGTAASRALEQAKLSITDMRYAAIYDSFTITLALLLEEMGFCALGAASRDAQDGRFDPGGSLPLNTHGGLLSYGHCGVAGALSHVSEAWFQMQELAAERQLSAPPELALIHADGGVMSSHVSLVLERSR